MSFTVSPEIMQTLQEQISDANADLAAIPQKALEELFPPFERVTKFVISCNTRVIIEADNVKIEVSFDVKFPEADNFNPSHIAYMAIINEALSAVVKQSNKS